MDKAIRAVTNRLNGMGSTGPVTEEGKAAVSQNARKHGLWATRAVMRDEDVGEFEEMREGIVGDLRPVGEVEWLLVERIVALAWRLRRVLRLECEARDFLTGRIPAWAEMERRGKDVPAGWVFARACEEGDAFVKMRRYEASFERALYRALDELRRRQAVRKRRGKRKAGGADRTNGMDRTRRGRRMMRRRRAERKAA